MAQVNLNAIDAIIVDGYVHLNDGKLALGGHLYQTLDKKVGKHRMPDLLTYLDQQTKLFKFE